MMMRKLDTRSLRLSPRTQDLHRSFRLRKFPSPRISTCPRHLPRSSCHNQCLSMSFKNLHSVEKRYQLEWTRKQKTRQKCLKDSSNKKRTESLRSVNFNNLYFNPSLKFLNKFKCMEFEKYARKSCPHMFTSAKAQYGDKDKLFVQNFLGSLTGATLTWFTTLDVSKVKKWADLVHVFVKQYKFNSEIGSDREKL